MPAVGREGRAAGAHGGRDGIEVLWTSAESPVLWRCSLFAWVPFHYFGVSPLIVGAAAVILLRNGEGMHAGAHR